MDVNKKIIIQNISLNKQPYFDVLEKISRNKIIEEFHFRNVEIGK